MIDINTREEAKEIEQLVKEVAQAIIDSEHCVHTEEDREHLEEELGAIDDAETLRRLKKALGK
ncbi:MAG: hypothetical protein G01um101456_648 [Parcubacteria group bacterium Gr01-1014_56]|nr:MAG: hypothetical protein G01um101456_648 [Parcubacteria group bacterium Gr01-1014_56]